jgi:hypothetical protein
MARTTIAGMTVLVPAVVAVVLLSVSTALACGENDDPGYRGPDGQCVSWCDFARICGGAAGKKCTPEHQSRILLTLRAVIKGDPSLPPCRGCGCKGGPGYRDGHGHCVGWDRLAKTCGSPPTTECEPEIVARTADEIARAHEAYAAHLKACP